MEEITGRLEDWTVEYTFTSVPIIWANIFDDAKKRFSQGTYIHTSAIITPIKDIQEGKIIKTRNSRYLLGKRLK